MPANSSFARQRRWSWPNDRLSIVACLVLSCGVAATDASGGEGTEPAEGPRADRVVEAKPRPRSIDRVLGEKTRSRSEAAPALPPLPLVGPASRPPVDPAVVPAQTAADTQAYSYQNIGNIPVGSEADLGFLRRFIRAFGDEPAAPEAPNPDAPKTRRGYDAPFKAPPMPFSDFIGPTIGVNDTSVFPLMEALYKGPNGQAWRDSRIKIFGWFDPSYNASTSRKSNIPLSYNIVPNSLQLSQVILIIERPLDTVQTDHTDWGFRFTNLYGIDYRYTTAKGWFSNQLLKHNHLYGWDPLQIQLDIYFPHVLDGTVMRIGRYISPLDIEAQLSPDNFLYTHSNMYAYDPYTFTGIQFTSRINDQWQMIYGVHGGNDMAPWTKSTQPNGEILLKWIAKNNKDSLFGGLDSIGKGYYSHQHDDLQVLGFTWSHKFNDRFTTMTEQYYIWQRQALQGGTVTNGTPHSFFPGVGPGKLLPGLSQSYGIVNYTSYILNDKALLVFRSDCLADFNGERTGIAGAYFENTLGYVRHLTSWAIFRPEVRYDYTSGQKGYDNGTKRDQFTFNMDLILRY